MTNDLIFLTPLLPLLKNLFGLSSTSFSFIYLLFGFWFFKTWSHYILQAGLELLVAQAGLELTHSSCFSFLSAEVIGMYHHAQFIVHFYLLFVCVYSTGNRVLEHVRLVLYH